MSLQLESLVPKCAEVSLQVGEDSLTLDIRRFSIIDQLWVKRNFGSIENWQNKLNPESPENKECEGAELIETMLKTVFQLTIDRKGLKSWEDLGTFIVSQEDAISLGAAVRVAIESGNPKRSSSVSTEVSKKKSSKRTGVK